MVDEPKAQVVLYGRDEGGAFVSDSDAFHVWVECRGWPIDFTSPLMGVAAHSDGHEGHVPRLMLQKHMSERKAGRENIRPAGDFFVKNDPSLANFLIDSQVGEFEYLLDVCLAWYSKPPELLQDIALADARGQRTKLIPQAPSIEGLW